MELAQCDGELERLLLLLEELSDTNYWIDGCFRVIMFCVKNKHLRFNFSSLLKPFILENIFCNFLTLFVFWLSSAVDLIKELNDKCSYYEVLMEVLLDQVGSTSQNLKFYEAVFSLTIKEKCFGLLMQFFFFLLNMLHGFIYIEYC